MTEVLPVPQINVVSIAEQGLPGPPGTAKPQGTFVLKAPFATRITLVSSQRYACLLTGLYGCSVASGQLCVTIYIDGVAVPGLDGALITTTVADILATPPAELPLGGKLEIELSDIVGASGLELTAG